MATREEIRERVLNDDVHYLLAQFVDLHGSPKVKLVPTNQFDRMIDDGVPFAGSAIPGLGQAPNSHDMAARIDLDSYTLVPWTDGVARFASDLFVDGEPLLFCPRQNLKRILSQVRSSGFTFNVGLEPEHHLVTKNENGSIDVWDPNKVDNLRYPCYDFKGTSVAVGYLRRMMDAMSRLGWEPYQSDHEDGNGQYEINFAYSNALTTADRYTFFKMMASEFAHEIGAIATHMAQPFTGRVGNGGHIHYHLADGVTNENLFLDDEDPRGLGLSSLAYQFIGGIFAHAPALCSVMSPTINCYKRLQVEPGITFTNFDFLWTPANISYGDNNRTQMIRTPGPGQLEERSMSSAANPYLALSAYVMAGLDGVQKKLDPGEPNLGNLYSLSLEEIRLRGIRILPQTLDESLAELKKDEVVQESLGVIYKEFVALKEAELREFRRQVTPWEIDRYLTLF